MSNFVKSIQQLHLLTRVPLACQDKLLNIFCVNDLRMKPTVFGE